MFAEMETGRQGLLVVKRLRMIRFGRCSVKMADVTYEKFQLPYDEIIMAYIEVCDEETGKVYRPGIMDLTEDMDGKVILCDCQNRRFELDVEQTGKTAGYILKQLALRAPYILIGAQEWFEDGDEEAFDEAGRMVSAMRELSENMSGGEGNLVRVRPFVQLLTE